VEQAGLYLVGRRGIGLVWLVGRLGRGETSFPVGGVVCTGAFWQGMHGQTHGSSLSAQCDVVLVRSDQLSAVGAFEQPSFSRMK
jgi:hypothetical protein